MGDAVMNYREPLVTKEMRYPQLSRRVKNMPNFILFFDVTTGRFQKLKPIISNSFAVILFKPLLACFLCNNGVYHDGTGTKVQNVSARNKHEHTVRRTYCGRNGSFTICQIETYNLMGVPLYTASQSVKRGEKIVKEKQLKMMG